MQVKTDTTVCPDLVLVSQYGYHKSVVKGKFRIWEFVSESGAAMFIKHVAKGKFRRQAAK